MMNCAKSNELETGQEKSSTKMKQYFENVIDFIIDLI